jgi:hypothetical protein
MLEIARPRPLSRIIAATDIPVVHPSCRSLTRFFINKHLFSFISKIEFPQSSTHAHKRPSRNLFSRAHSSAPKGLFW